MTTRAFIICLLLIPVVACVTEIEVHRTQCPEVMEKAR